MMKFNKDYAAIITAVYQKYNPEKIKDVPSLLEKYATREEELLERIFTKYQLSKAERIQFYNEDHELSSSTDTPRYAQFQVQDRLHKQSTPRWIYALIILLAVISITTAVYIFHKKERDKEKEKIETWILPYSDNFYMENVMPAGNINLYKRFIFEIDETNVEILMEEQSIVQSGLGSSISRYLRIKDDEVLIEKQMTYSYISGTERETSFQTGNNIYIKLPRLNQPQNWSYVDGDEKNICLSYFDAEKNLIVQRDIRDNNTNEHYVRIVEHYKKAWGLFRIDQIDPKKNKIILQYKSELNKEDGTQPIQSLKANNTDYTHSSANSPTPQSVKEDTKQHFSFDLEVDYYVRFVYEACDFYDSTIYSVYRFHENNRLTIKYISKEYNQVIRVRKAAYNINSHNHLFIDNEHQGSLMLKDDYETVEVLQHRWCIYNLHPQYCPY